jgi:hypothetical protein
MTTPINLTNLRAILEPARNESVVLDYTGADLLALIDTAEAAIEVRDHFDLNFGPEKMARRLLDSLTRYTTNPS